MYKYLRRLSNAIINNRFNESAYYRPHKYYGIKIATGPLFCSYGQIGFCVTVYSDTQHELEYDWEMKKLTIDGLPYQDAINLL